MSVTRFLAALLLSVLAGALACDREQSAAGQRASAHLTPLGPRIHTFATPAGLGRNTYFLVAAEHRADPAWRTALLAALRAQHSALDASAAVDSLYVYLRDDVLNERFQGDANALRGTYDEHLVAYARWTAGREDIIWMIEHGQVVHDLRTGNAVQPFDFD